MNKKNLLILLPLLTLASCGGKITTEDSSELSLESESQDITLESEGPASETSEEASTETSEDTTITPLTLTDMVFRDIVGSKVYTVDSYTDSEFSMLEESSSTWDVSLDATAKFVTIKRSGSAEYIGYAGEKSNLTQNEFAWILAEINSETNEWGLTCTDQKSNKKRIAFARHQSYSYSGTTVDKVVLRAYEENNLNFSDEYASVPAYFLTAEELAPRIATLKGEAKSKTQKSYEAKCLYRLTYNKESIDSLTASALTEWGIIE